MLSEFELISRYFIRQAPAAPSVALGIGDDCALLVPAPGMQLAVSSDMLVEGRHFFPGTDPVLLGHKCLATNLSDLAAMGASPLGFTLALALPAVDETWLAGFSHGLFSLADQFHCPLVGGDTTRGPLTISITIMGQVPAGSALRRDGAQPGDDIWVSGTPGDARLGLASYRDELVLPDAFRHYARNRMDAPTPRIALGLALRGIARSAIDISDGLAGDLGHILTASGTGATLQATMLPRSPALAAQADTLQYNFALSGGDDYELCFTAAPDQQEAILAAALASQTQVTRIGTIDATTGLRIVDAQGNLLAPALSSFDHFKS